jgi:energy-coupling factor transporter ATP-binding protein EcfA2
MISNVSKFTNIPYGLPEMAFSCMVLGSRGSGKSQLIKKLCQIYMPQIKEENRFIISPTVYLDNTLSEFFTDEDNKFSEYTDEIIDVIIDIIQERMNKQKEQIKKDTIKRLGINDDEILEDKVKQKIEKHYKQNLEKYYKPENNILIVEDSLGMFKPKSKLVFLFTRHRWYNLTVIISSQSFRSLPVVIRNNCILNFIFPTNNKELKKITEEFNNFKNDSSFMKMFNKYVYGYNTLLINRTKPKKEQYYQGIDRYIDMKEFE